jgi:hypothetical protein
METTGLEPATAESNASTEISQVDTDETAAEGADPATAAAETGKPAPRDKVQERFDQLTREKYEGLSRAERAEWRAQDLERRLQEIEARTAKPETVAPSNDFPTLESVGFDDAKYAAAVAAWSAKQAREAARAELDAEREEAEEARTEQEWSRREAEFIKSKPDYAVKVLRPPSAGGPVISDEMALVIKSSEIGAEVAYYLAENVEKSVEIARLPAHLQAREIGRIEARLEAAKAAPPPVSKAPPPAPKLDAAAATDDSEPNPSWSDDRWEKWRRRQISQRG